MSKSFARSALNKALSDKAEYVKLGRAEINAIKACKAEIIHVISQLTTFFGTNERDFDQPRVSTYVSAHWSDRPMVTFSYRGASSFKDESIASAMQYLMDVGFTADKTYDVAELINREFVFNRNDIKVKLDVYVKSDSPTCRKVVTGETTQTIKTYAIECD